MTMESPQPTKDCPDCGIEMVHVSPEELNDYPERFLGYAEKLDALGWHCESCGSRLPDAEPILVDHGLCGLCLRDHVDLYWWEWMETCRSCTIDAGGHFSG